LFASSCVEHREQLGFPRVGREALRAAARTHTRKKAWHGKVRWRLDWTVGCKPTSSDHFLRVLELTFAIRLGVIGFVACVVASSSASLLLVWESDFAVCTPLCGLGWRDAIIHMYKFFAVLGSIGCFFDLIRSQSNR